MSFVHLHVHSEYSLLEASCRIKELAKKAQTGGMPAIALTDLGNMFAAIEFYFACQSSKVKPIVGMEVFLAPGSRLEKNADNSGGGNFREGPQYRRLVLLAQSLEGYRNLCRLSSSGFQEGFYWKPRIDYEILEKYNQDLICLTGSFFGDVPDTFLKEGPDAARAKVLKLQNIFQDRLYLELTRTGQPDWEKVTNFLTSLGQELKIPVVAANNVYYTQQDDQIIQEVLVCIGTNKTLQDEHRPKLGTNQLYLKSAEEMKTLFADIPEAIENTLRIAERCDLKFKMKDEQGKAIYHLPSFPTQGGASLQDEIRRLAEEGLKERFQEAEMRQETISEEAKPTYFDRLNYELMIIDKMGFSGYFLIVQDFINWAKVNDIPVGPGRGSGAGSLIAYSLKVTDLDPVQHKLLFERFLNPERISMPDFDIDFCQDRRQEVIQYVTQKYGEKSVSQIITYGKLQTKAAIKDVGRTLGMSFAETDAVTKLVPEKLGITLTEAIETEPRLRELMEINPQVQTLMELALRVEGLVRHAGIHAAGVIIADGELVLHAPLYKGSDGENVVQYDMKHAEKIGLIKFDFLGLKTLTHINHALHLIEKNRGRKIRAHEISLSDKGIYDIMSRGDTAGIFQFEGEGITDAIRKIRPSGFGDITAINALYRPGPMAMIPEFAKRKHGESPVEYLFEELKGSLEETYGIIVYQEQVMAIASEIAGYSLGEADMLRRAMGKKIKEEMDAHRERFLKGAKEKGFNFEKSNELFDLMYKFADYGFNKSHAAAYCVIAAQTAWLKNYYPTEFYAALLSTEISDTDKVVKYVKDARRHQIEVRTPHVSFSDYLFSVKGDTIYFGLGAIKGVGENAVRAIVQAREDLPEKVFHTLDEFFNSVDVKKLNKKVVECLIKSGALDGFGCHRAQIFQNYQKYLDRAQGLTKDKAVGQGSLFDIAPSVESTVTLEKVAAWNRMASLTYEKEVLGFYLSDHPLKGIDTLLRTWTTCRISELSQFGMDPNSKSSQSLDPEKPDKNDKSKQVEKKDWRARRDEGKKRVHLLGIISELREFITKKGTRMAFGKIEDLSGACEIVIFPDVFSANEFQIKSESPVVITGLLEVSEGMAKVVVESMSPMADLFKKAKKLSVRLLGLTPEDVDKLNQIFCEFPGKVEVNLELHSEELQKKVILSAKNQVDITGSFLESIQVQFGRTDFVQLN